MDQLYPTDSSIRIPVGDKCLSEKNNLINNVFVLAADTTSIQTAGAAPQTYIVAQNPLVLAHLLRENQQRSIDPQAYTTPASVFNTVAVDFAEKLPEKDPDLVEKIVNPKPDEKIDIPLHTVPIPVAGLHKLDPIVPSSSSDPPPDETLTVIVGARESCDNLCQNLSPRTDASKSFENDTESLPSEPYASRVRSLERNTKATLSTAERVPIRMGSLERNARGGLSHRGSPVPIAPFTRQHSVPASPPPRSRRDRDVGQFSVQGALNAQLAASVVNKMRQRPDPPLVEEIYDFGGDNVKSCAAIAAQKAGYPKPQVYRQAMSVSHPTSYNVPVGIVQGVPYSQAIGMKSPGHVAIPSTCKSYYPPRSSSPAMQAYPAQGGTPPITYCQQIGTSQVLYSAQCSQSSVYRPQILTVQVPSRGGISDVIEGPASPRPQFSSATSVDVQALYASRRECSAITQPVRVPQMVQVIE